MTPQASVVISSHNRLGLFRRVLWNIAERPPSVPFEVVVVDDNSTEDVLGELKQYSSRFEWTFARFNAKDFEAATGLKKEWNNPCVTNNLGFRLSRGEFVFQQGNEVIPVGDVYDRLIADYPVERGEPSYGIPYGMVMSTTYDVPPQELDKLDRYGTNVNEAFVRGLYRWELQSKAYRSDVTNYISLTSKALWEALGGYDERYYAGISAEDSDFVRRARLLPEFKQVVSEGVSLHQYHGGKTCYYDPPPSVITKARWDELVAMNHAIYNAWDQKTVKNQQKWPWGTLGLGEVITNHS